MLGFVSREELYDRLTPTQHEEWVEYYQQTGFTQPGLRMGLAQLTATVINFANSFGVDKNNKPKQITLNDVVIPQPSSAAEDAKKADEQEFNANLRKLIGR